MPPNAPQIQPWVLDVAQGMLEACKNANHMGELTFTWAGKTLVRVERNADKGLVVTFPEPVR